MMTKFQRNQFNSIYAQLRLNFLIGELEEIRNTANDFKKSSGDFRSPKQVYRQKMIIGFV